MIQRERERERERERDQKRRTERARGDRLLKWREIKSKRYRKL